MIRPGTIVLLLLVLAVGYAMFQVKYEVMQQEETLTHLNRQITESRERLRVLGAEWSYLTRPARLDGLAQHYLDLTPISAAQIVPLSAVPLRPDAPQALVSGGAPDAAFATVTAGRAP